MAETFKQTLKLVADKLHNGERVVFMMPRRPGRAKTIQECKEQLRRLGHSELEIAQLMSRTLYRR